MQKPELFARKNKLTHTCEVWPVLVRSSLYVCPIVGEVGDWWMHVDDVVGDTPLFTHRPSLIIIIIAPTTTDEDDDGDNDACRLPLTNV